MKKMILTLACALTAMFFGACQKDNSSYKSFVGTWGVERIDYKSYNTDWQGAPVQGSMEESSYAFDPNDTDNGIHLIFREDKTGEMRDSAIDSLLNEEDSVYIYCPDTVLVSRFTYSFDREESILYMTMDTNAHTYRMSISNLTANSFMYENNYGKDADNRVYIEIAHMKRVADLQKHGTGRKASRQRPIMPGSFLSGK